jgi:SPP1 gp7 family putative phage head morphogenesis protein
MNADKLASIIIRHATASQRLSKKDADDIVRLLNSADKDIAVQIASRVAAMRTAGIDKGLATTARLRDLLEAVRALNDEVYSKVGTQATTNLTDRAQYEFDFSGKAVSAVGVTYDNQPPSADFLKTLVNTTPIHGVLLNDWLDGLSTARMKRIEQELRLGIFQGETTDQIVQRIIGTKANKYTDGLMDMSRKSAQSFVITANSTIQNAARLEVFKNTGAFPYLEWSSILDSRTSQICQGLSGRIFAINEPHPTPPAHIRCRSLLLPRTNKTDAPLHRTYGDWLKGQSEKTQAEILGKERARVFRDNPKMDFGDFFRKDNTYMSLEELKAHDASMFNEIAPTKAAIDIAALDAKERAYVIERGLATENEHLTGYDRRTGEQVIQKSGGKDYVEFTDSLVKLIDDSKSEIVLHHNHPRSSSFSEVDVKITQRPGSAGVWAHGHNESSFFVERGSIALKSGTVKSISEYFRSRLQNEISAGRMSIDDAQLMHNHLVWLAVHDTGQAVYRAELKGTSLTAWKKHEAYFTQLLEALK